MKKLGIVLLLLCFLLASGTVMAETEVTISAQLDVSDFCIDVTVDGLTPFARISVFAMPKDAELGTAIAANKGVYAEQTMVGASGGLQRHIGFLSSAKAGEYVIVIADETADKVYKSEPFAYRTEKDMENALGAVNGATAETIVTVLTENNGALLLDTTEYDLLEDQTAVAGMFLNARPATGFTKPEEIHNAFGAAVATVAMKTSKTPVLLLTKYADALGIDGALLAACSADEATAAMEVLQEKAYTSPSALAQAYPGAIFAGKVNAAATAGEIRTYFLTTYAEKLTLDLTDYNKLSNPLQVFVTLMNQKVTGFEDAKEKFNVAVTAQAAVEKDATQGGSVSTGGGGGFGGGGGYAITPQEQPTTNEAENNADTTTENNNGKYSDLGDAAWAETYINYLTDQGIVSGDGDGLFRPNDSVTRAEFVKMLTLALDIPQQAADSTFADVAQDAWYAPYVAAGVNAGIVRGVGGNLFGAEDKISRQDLTVMCSRAASYAELALTAVSQKTPADFVTTAEYAKDAVAEFYSAGIISGDPSGAFRPQDGATRAEVAKIIAELMQRKEAVN